MQTHSHAAGKCGIMYSMPKTLKKTLFAWPVVFLGTIAVCWLTQALAKGLFGIDLPAQQSLGYVSRARGFELAKIVFLVAVAAPVMEEFIFRFLLYKLPLKIGGWIIPKLIYYVILFPLIVAICSSAVFSFAHYVDTAVLAKSGEFVFLGWNNAFLALFFFGMMQCWLYSSAKWLLAPILNHSLFNLTNLVLLFIFPETAG